MKNFIEHLKSLSKRILIIVILFQLCRLLFLLFNLKSFGDISFIETLRIFFFGIRFDLSAIIIFYFPVFILFLLPGNFRNKLIYQKILKYLFFIITAIILLLNFIDIEYFKYTNKRSTADLFDLFGYGNDMLTLLPQFIKDFWYIILLWISFIFIAWFFYPSFIKVTEKYQFRIRIILKESIALIIIAGILIVIARGLDFKPVRIITAARYTTPNNIPLILNTPFTILKTINSQNLESPEYFSKEESLQIFDPHIQINNEGEFKNLNVVVIIVESLSKEYIGTFNQFECYTPFLDSLFNESYILENSYANGQKSIEALPAIFSSLPAIMNDPYISSPYASNKIYSLANILKTKGYSSSFFHGGANGTMGFDNFVYAAGFDNYYGRDEYTGKDDYDGNWGIFDEEYLQYFANTLSTFNQPFFSTVFTLSSHHPYTIPEKHKGKFKKGKMDIHQSILYTDYSLRKFFEAASQMPWYNNTLFVITADHTSTAYYKYYKNKVGKYTIPLVFYNPGDPGLKGRSNKVCQQTDIMPSVLDYLNYNGEILAFGQSCFNNNRDHFAVNYINGIFQIIEDNHSLFFDGEKSIELYNLQSDRNLETNILESKNELKEKLESKLKSIIQTYYDCLINNQLHK
ncbi:LTA synthase family protein [Bacteroidota bacterium]